MKSIIQASSFRIRDRRIGSVLCMILAFGPASAADLDNDGLPDDWEALHAGTFAVWPPDLYQTLLPYNTAARSFLLSNDTAVAVNFTATLSNNTVPIYGAYDSITGGVTYAWDEISSTGTRLSSISAADDDTETVTITGFTFPFYGTNYSQVYVSSNGLLTFGYGDASPGNNQIPGSTAPSNAIAAFWDDLDTRTTGDIYYKVETNRLIIQYQNVGRYSGTGSYTFQVVLHSNGTLNLRYKTMTGTLDSASIGIEGNNQWEGVGIVHDAAYAASSLAVEIDTFSEFFSMPVLTGLVPAYSVASLDGYFDSLSLPPGLYTADVSVAHTGAGTSPLGLSATLTVPDQPGSVSITSPSSSISVMQGEMLWIEATATDPDGMEKVEFYDGATKIGEISSSPGYDYHSFGWYVDTNGSRSITAKGIDYFGGVSVSSAVTVSATANVDYDGMPDSWEIANYLDPNDPNDGPIDADLDGYTNLEEYQFGLDPQYPEDTDFDGMPDGWEYHNGTNINTDDSWVDTDTDGLTNIEEYWYGTNPLTFDTDGDRLPDLWEINNWFDPLTFSADDDADLDGLTNLEEFLNQTNPNDGDSDGDGKSDGEEVDQGSNPNDPADGGNPPSDPLESVEFVVGGDYASWRMEIKSLGPRDSRTLLVVSPAPNQWETKSHKLWKNNKYEITMHHTGSRPQDDPPWYCWEGQIEGKPGLETFETLPDWQLGARNTNGKYFVIKDHWVVDNVDGLLTSHLHSKGVNNVGSKKAYLTPVDIVTTFGFGGEPGKATTTAYLEGIKKDKFGKFYIVDGKTPAGADKVYSVLLGDNQADLQQGLATEGCFVVFDGHSNMGLGPSFDTASIARLSDFMNISNTYTAINWPYLVEEEYPNLTTIAANEIPASPNNYNVPNLATANPQRYPNTSGVAPGSVFTKTGTGMAQKHFNRAGGNIYLIVKAGTADLPTLKYDSYFYNSCNTGRDYIEVFTQGTMFYTGDECSSSDTTKIYVESIIAGKRGAQVLTAINAAENVNHMISR